MAQSRVGREGTPFTLDDLAACLRGQARDTPFFVEMPDGLAPVVFVVHTRVAADGTAAGDGASGTQAKLAVVLRIGPARGMQEPHGSAGGAGAETTKAAPG